ncbi:MAG: ABC transporter ATP-binding protein [Deltaproteobacteria bacterium]|nr:ABC transporter ATP-binding protein [Deltaproteobacteria bacterium]
MLEVKDLHTSFFLDAGELKAVRGISFTLGKGKTIGIVGESGCGKSVTALSIMRLVPHPGKIISGEIIYSPIETFGNKNNKDLLKLSEEEMHHVRGNEISMIFQESMTSLNPVFTIGSQIKEAIKLHQDLGKKEVELKVIEMLKLVGIPSPERRTKDYPHQLSGGMRQRVMIAMALSCNPNLLIADEPTTALDVTIQAQILELIRELQQKLGMAVMLITHDLGIVAETADDVLVMYAGRVVEYTDTKSIFQEPMHPYTIGLIESLPCAEKVEGKRKSLKTIKGMVPNLLQIPSGCIYKDRCPNVDKECNAEEPELKEIKKGHWVACFKR